MHAREFPAMAKPPGRCDYHPGQPRPAPHDHHPGPWLSAFMLRAEGAQARHETVRITAPVRMMRPDEIPAAAPGLIHLPIRLSRVATIDARLSI
jgi:hypothetical protein